MTEICLKGNTMHRPVSFINVVSIAIISVVLTGCTFEKKPTVPVVEHNQLEPAKLTRDDPKPLPEIVEVKVPVASPQLRSLATIQASGRKDSATHDVAQILANAKASATTQPTPDGFINAVQYYDYAPGIVFSAVTSPGYVTSIALRPGEQLVTAAAGDTTRWIVESVAAGTGENQQTIILIKPRQPYLDTNLVITTNERVYTLDLVSTDKPAYHTMIAWHYPFGDLVTIRKAIQKEQTEAQATITSGMELSHMDFNYQILRQDDKSPPAWCPLRAFDDGKKTYIQFPPKLLVTEAPPLFVLGRKGDRQLVNYRVKGDYYIVDRLFDRAELRVGEKPQTVVAIVKAQPK